MNCILLGANCKLSFPSCEERSSKNVFLLFLLLLMAFGCKKKSEEPVTNLKPEDNRFTPVVVTPIGSLNEPMAFEVLRDESVIIIERQGSIKKWDAANAVMKSIGKLAIFNESEQGLVGMTLDPHFETNHWIYLYYAPLESAGFELTRWTLENDTLLPKTKKVLLEVPSNRTNTSHTGGGMTWDKAGNLYLTVGNNTSNSLYSQTDEREGREKFDDQRGAANTNDLRGKILRIHPEPNGTYTIPRGNLFPVGTKKTRPEIYAMGNRNPWRVSLDSKTGFVYWGEVGPDADSDSEKGPMGYDELNQARKPGFFGWPYFIGENHAYPMYDYVHDKLGAKQDSLHPINHSVNNTGLMELPEAQPAFISYPYRPSEKFPLVGSSSRCAIGGPIFRRDDFINPARPFPTYHEGKWLAADLSRFWIMAINMNESGDYVSMERFVPDYHPRQPIDMKFGPTGDLYVLEYGGNTANSSIESRLVRIEYSAGNRKPVVNATSDKVGASLPAIFQLNAEGSKDFDGDPLLYQWEIKRESTNKVVQQFNTSSITLQLNEEGVYFATLTVTDDKGLANSKSLKLIAGNEPPAVAIKVDGNQSFFFPNEKINYSVSVDDKEDGSFANGKIKVSEVALSIDYISEGFDYAQVNYGQVQASQFSVALSLMAQSDCKTCHHPEVKGVGPAFKKIAERYAADAGAVEKLAVKIRKGSYGQWDMETAMPAHPTITPNNARIIANYILSIDKIIFKPTKGSFITSVPEDDAGRGTYVLRAAYTDKGNGTIPSLANESIVMLKSATMIPVNADVIEGAIRDQLDEYTFLTARPNSFISFKGIDLTNVVQIKFQPNWHLYDIFKGGSIEVHLDSPSGELIGKTTLSDKQFNTRYRGLFIPPPGEVYNGVKPDMSLPQLDASKFFAPGVDKSLYTLPSIAAIKKTTGFHDVYFVFKNDKLKPEESLFPLAYIEFMNTLTKN